MPPKATPTEGRGNTHRGGGNRGGGRGNRGGNPSARGHRGGSRGGEGRGRVGAPPVSHAASIAPPPQGGAGRGAARGGTPSAGHDAGSPQRGGHHGGEGRGNDPSRGRSHRGRGRGRGTAQAQSSDGSTPNVRAPQVAGSVVAARTLAADHVRSDILKRPGFGTLSVKQLNVTANVYEVNVPDQLIRHYDDIEPEAASVAMNIKVIRHLCEEVAPEVFMPRTSTNPDVFRPTPAFDGRRNMYATREIDLGQDPGEPASWVFSLQPPRPNARRPPRLYTVTIRKVATINPEVLHEFIAGEQSPDSAVLTAIMAVNVAIRMDVIFKYPVNSRSFFVPHGKRDIGGGVELWRGYFQSVRPAMERMLINIDITTAMMYRAGPLIGTCLSFFDMPAGNPLSLSPGRGLTRRQISLLKKFLLNVQVKTIHNGRMRRIRGLTERGANAMRFDFNGREISVADYFRLEANRSLGYSEIICIEVETGAIIPLELCEVPEGQITKKELYRDKTRDMLDFSRMKPPQRFQAIRDGLNIMAFHESPTVRDFGFSLKSSEPLVVPARVLPTPAILYNTRSKVKIAQPANGAWNAVDRIFHRPANIRKWAIMIYAPQRHFNEASANKMIQDLTSAAVARGMGVLTRDPVVKWENGLGNIAEQFLKAGYECAQREPEVGEGPNLFVVILPNQAGEIYTAVKHFGDVTRGVPTQCLQEIKAKRANNQYWNNVLLKINVKMGGTNSILDPTSNAAPFLSENTIVMGADVMHPPARSEAEGIPSYASVVGSVDAHSSYYVATTQAQEPRVESILDLKGLCVKIIKKYMNYHENVENKGSGFLGPKRLVFFRDGVSEGEFAMVRNHELTEIRDACRETGVKPDITLVVVGKRHHYRFCPSEQDADQSGNCPAGMVIDQTITHPVNFDYFLQSQGGLIGTSRPAHYTVIHDENNFSVDSIQQLSFALCHVFARATRSVSIPAPVYYAHLVCQRAKNHYEPRRIGSDSASVLSGLQNYQAAFKPLHNNQATNMYFM